jgi:hypothetical protein
MAYVLGSMDAARNADFHSSQALTAILGTLALQHRLGVGGFPLDKPAQIVLVRLLPSVIDGRIGTKPRPPAGQAREAGTAVLALAAPKFAP